MCWSPRAERRCLDATRASYPVMHRRLWLAAVAGFLLAQGVFVDGGRGFPPRPGAWFAQGGKQVCKHKRGRAGAGAGRAGRGAGEGGEVPSEGGQGAAVEVGAGETPSGYSGPTMDDTGNGYEEQSGDKEK